MRRLSRHLLAACASASGSRPSCSASAAASALSASLVRRRGRGEERHRRLGAEHVERHRLVPGGVAAGDDDMRVGCRPPRQQRTGPRRVVVDEQPRPVGPAPRAGDKIQHLACRRGAVVAPGQRRVEPRAELDQVLDQRLLALRAQPPHGVILAPMAEGIGARERGLADAAHAAQHRLVDDAPCAPARVSAAVPPFQSRSRRPASSRSRPVKAASSCISTCGWIACAGSMEVGT